MKKQLVVILIIAFILICILVLLYLNIPKNTDNNIAKIEKVSFYNNPVIPEGFKKVETTSASWKLENDIPIGWNNGLVIEDEQENQFVWVPVNLEKITYNNEYVEKQFRYNAEELNINNIEDKQILKYGGFYISRYEAGVAKEMQQRFNNISAETNDVLGKPVSQKGILPWNFISLKKAKLNAESMYNNNNLKSGLPTQKQWQSMIAWLYSCNYNVYEDSSSFGNYSNVNFIFSGYYSDDYGENYQYAENKMKSGKNMILSTGATDRNMTNNIYDIAGNLWCYTDDYLQINENEILGYYCSGGHFDHTGDIFSACNNNLKNVEPLEKVGFRVVLYLN